MMPAGVRPCVLGTLRLLQSTCIERILPSFLGLMADEAGAKACGRLAIITRDREALREAEMEHFNCHAIDWHLIEVEGPVEEDVPWWSVGDMVIDEDGHWLDADDYRELFRITAGLSQP